MLRPARNNTRFYVLTAVHGGDALTGRPNRSPAPYQLRIEPVELAAYLKTKQIAVHIGSNQVRFELLHQWAEPLDEALRRILSEDLRQSALRPTVITDQPGRPGAPTYDIAIQVLHCEGMSNSGQSSARFDVLWQITSNRHLEQGEFHMKGGAWNGQAYGPLAAQLSRGVRELAQALLQQLNHLAKKASSG